MIDLRTRILRVLRAEMDGWTAEFAQTAHAVPLGVRAGKIPTDLLDAYPAGTYPVELSKVIAHRIGLPFSDDETQYTEHGFLLNVTAEAIGVGIDAMRGLSTGDVGVLEEGGIQTWLFYRETLDSHAVTIDQLSDFVTGMSWEDVALLMVDAHNVPIQVANAPSVDGTGGWVARWLRPGDLTELGWPVPAPHHGLQLTTGIGTEMTGDPAGLAQLGERMAMRWQSPLVMALSDLGDTLTAEIAKSYTELGQTLDCTTADALAKVLALSGHFDTAARIISQHALADDEPDHDRHGHIRFLAGSNAIARDHGRPVDLAAADGAADDYLRKLLDKS